MQTPRTMQTGTVEYLEAIITADVQLDTQAVQIRIDNETWLAAQWAGTAGTTRTAQVLLGTDNPLPAKGAHRVYAKITDSPEAPVLDCGTLYIA